MNKTQINLEFETEILEPKFLNIVCLGYLNEQQQAIQDQVPHSSHNLLFYASESRIEVALAGSKCVELLIVWLTSLTLNSQFRTGHMNFLS